MLNIIKGLNILLAQYYERIRDAKFLFDRLLRDINFSLNPIFNNTIYNSNLPGSDSISNKNVTISKLHPFNIFNEEKIQDLSIINRFIIRPAYKNLTDQLETSINSSLESFKLAYIVVFGIYFIGLLSFYIFVWRPFENNLNLTVYIIYNRFTKPKICFRLFLKKFLQLLVVYIDYLILDRISIKLLKIL
jgi:hypothetical protein